MDKRTQELQLLELLHSALASDHGIAVSTNDSHRLRQRLYAVRRGDPRFARLSFRPCPADPEHELWIEKNDKDQAEEAHL